MPALAPAFLFPNGFSGVFHENSFFQKQDFIDFSFISDAYSIAFN